MSETMARLGYNASVRAVDMPDRIRALPISPAGFPVPWFVAWQDGIPDFRVIRARGVAEAHKRKICWVCGQPMGRFLAMTLGPMCAITRSISEPPSHRECAVFAAKACPFLANPRMRRNHVGLAEDVKKPPGNGIARNPGAVAVWITRGYRPFRVSTGGSLFTFDDPVEVLWFAEGRAATRAEIMESIDSGFPLLAADAARQGGDAPAALRLARKEALYWLPAA